MTRMDLPVFGEERGEALIGMVHRSVIGEDEAVVGPFGVRKVIYCDYTASGRSLSVIEDFLREAVLPLYANTHTESSGTGRQTTRFREDARRIIRRAVGGLEEHAVIFCGSGSTGAIDRLIGVLNLRIPHDLDVRYGLSEHIPAEERPVVFIGPYEHHSNELPWRESIADVVTIHEDLHGGIDLDELEARLVEYKDRPLRIGSFSAASNVTGITSPVRDVSIILHRHGALSFWDFAAAAPYVRIEMGPQGDSGDDALDYKDAIFLSPHKMIGGPGTPGVLVARRELFSNSVPDVVGGGTVSYVNPTEHYYLDDPEVREEGGTPAIIESIRAGLVFLLKSAVGEEVIRTREESFIRAYRRVTPVAARVSPGCRPIVIRLSSGCRKEGRRPGQRPSKREHELPTADRGSASTCRPTWHRGRMSTRTRHRDQTRFALTPEVERRLVLGTEIKPRLGTDTGRWNTGIAPVLRLKSSTCTR